MVDHPCPSQPSSAKLISPRRSPSGGALLFEARASLGHRIHRRHHTLLTHICAVCLPRKPDGSHTHGSVLACSHCAGVANGPTSMRSGGCPTCAPSVNSSTTRKYFVKSCFALVGARGPDALGQKPRSSGGFAGAPRGVTPQRSLPLSPRALGRGDSGQTLTRGDATSIRRETAAGPWSSLPVRSWSDERVPFSEYGSGISPAPPFCKNRQALAVVV